MTAGGRDDFDSGSPLAGSKKANRAATDVWTTAAHFSKSPPCNDCGGQRFSPEPRFCAHNETGDLTEKMPMRYEVSGHLWLFIHPADIAFCSRPTQETSK